MLTVLVAGITTEVRLQSTAFHGMERTVQMWEMGGYNVVGKRMEGFRLWNIVSLIGLFPNVIKALNRADQLVQFCFVLTPWHMGFARGQNFLRFLKRQQIIDQVLVKF